MSATKTMMLSFTVNADLDTPSEVKALAKRLLLDALSCTAPGWDSLTKEEDTLVRQLLDERATPPEVWVTFTRCTNNPKLSWIKRQLDELGVPHRCERASWHAPILEVHPDDLDKAWTVLAGDVDDIPDDDPRFSK